jgi:hypothetical protein
LAPRARSLGAAAERVGRDALPRAGGCVLESDNVERLFTFVEMEKELKKTNRSFYQYPGRIPPDAVRGAWRGGVLAHDAARRGAGARCQPASAPRVPRCPDP